MYSVYEVYFEINGGSEICITESALTRDEAVMRATICLTLTHKDDEDFINTLVGVSRVCLLPRRFEK